MKNFASLACFIIVSLFGVAFIVRRYLAANAVQRRQILWAAAGALVVAAGLFCAFALSHLSG